MRNTCHRYQDLLRHFQPIYNQIYQRPSGCIGFDHGPDCNDHSKKEKKSYFEFNSTVFFTIFVCRGTDPEIVKESASCRQGVYRSP